MKFLITYDSGEQLIVCEDTWNEVMRHVGCAVISIIIIPDETPA